MKYVSNPKLLENTWHYEAKCKNCGETFHAKRSTAKYCSATCRMMDWHKTHDRPTGKKIPTKKTKIKEVKPKVETSEFAYKEVLNKNYVVAYLGRKGVKGIGDGQLMKKGETVVYTGGTVDSVNGIEVKRLSFTNYLVTVKKS